MLILFTNCKIKTIEKKEIVEGVVLSKCFYITNTKIKHGKCIEFSFSGDTIGKFNYKNGKLDGIQYFYYESGGYKNIVQYSNDIIIGKKTAFYKNGKIKYEVEYNNGSLWEINALYDFKGRELDKGSLKKGNGLVVVYYDDGSLKYKGQYLNGKPHGNWLSFTDTGNKDILEYNKGIDDSGFEVMFY